MTELYHYNHNHSKVDGKFISGPGGPSGSGGSSFWKKKKKQLPDAEVIKKGKAANNKLSDDERNRIVKSGTKEEVAANKDRMSTKELKAAVDRLEQEKETREILDTRLDELMSPEGQAAIEEGKTKLEKAAETLQTVDQYKETGMKAWNMIAQIHNLKAPDNDKWPTFNNKGKPESNAPQPDVIDLIANGSASDILKNKDKFTTTELKEAITRREQYEALQGIADKEAAQNASNMQATKTNTIFGKKTTQSDSMADVAKAADHMTDAQLDEAINRYQNNQARQQKIDKIKRWAEQETANAEKERQANIPVQVWIDDNTDGVVVENGKILKKKVKWRKA